MAIAVPPPRRRTASSTVELQRALRLLGWPIRVDGVIGEQTTSAVRDFQRGYAFSTLVAGGGVGPPGPVDVAHPDELHRTRRSGRPDRVQVHHRDVAAADDGGPQAGHGRTPAGSVARAQS